MISLVADYSAASADAGRIAVVGCRAGCTAAAAGINAAVEHAYFFAKIVGTAMISDIADKVAGITESSGTDGCSAKRSGRTLDAFRATFTGGVTGYTQRVRLIKAAVAGKITFFAAVAKSTAVCRSNTRRTVASTGIYTVVRQAVVSAFMVIRIADEITDEILRSELPANWRAVAVYVRAVHAVLPATIRGAVLHTDAADIVISLIAFESTRNAVAGFCSIADIGTGRTGKTAMRNIQVRNTVGTAGMVAVITEERACTAYTGRSTVLHSRTCIAVNSATIGRVVGQALSFILVIVFIAFPRAFKTVAGCRSVGGMLTRQTGCSTMIY